MKIYLDDLVFWGLFLLLIIIAASLPAWGQTINPGESFTIRCANCPPPPACPQCPVCPTPTPIPTAVPTPTPDTCPTKVTGNAFRTAEANAKPGDCIEVTSGTITGQLYLNKSGTADKPITYKFAPGVVIKPGSWTDANAQFRANGSYLILDGITVEGGYAAKIMGHNVTVQNGKITNQRYSCLDVVGVDYPRILNSEFAWCGFDTSGKRYEANGNPKQYHGIYFTPNGKGIRGAYVKGAKIHDITGRGIQINGDSGGTVELTVEDSKFWNLVYGVIVWNGGSGVTIKNNDFLLGGAPATNSETACVGGYNSKNITVSGNTCKTPWRGNACNGFFQNHSGVSGVNCSGNSFK